MKVSIWLSSIGQELKGKDKIIYTLSFTKANYYEKRHGLFYNITCRGLNKQYNILREVRVDIHECIEIIEDMDKINEAINLLLSLKLVI